MKLGLPLTDDGVLMHKWLIAAIAAWLLFAGNAEAQSGIASVYAYRGGKTASGQAANPARLTAAHRSLPFGTKVKVTNKRNGKTVVVTINDRGPFVRGRIIDLTPAGSRALGFSGLAPVSIAKM
jgi:rare lipoprotein A